MTTKTKFIEAVQNDEFAEYELESGDTLVTDWEGDDYFNPYIVPKNDDQSRASDVGDAIAMEFDVAVRHVETFVGDGGVFYYPDMDRPTK